MAQTIGQKHEKTIINLIDSFKKICDFIEETEDIGCARCPVFKECFKQDKHIGLSELMEDLKIKRD